MTTRLFILIGTLLLAGAGMVRADGRAGTVEWSDGKKVAGAISLTPGKDLRLFTTKAEVGLHLDEVREIHVKVEKEEMSEGFYFPNAGQATQAKTGEVYPTREFSVEITLVDGKVLEGHLFTTMFYVENDDGTQKVLLEAKQTGKNGQKLADLAYPTAIQFGEVSPFAGMVQVDLSKTGFSAMKELVVMAKPDLEQLAMQQMGGESIWAVPLADPGKILFSVVAKDGIHVSWPEKGADPAITQLVETGLKTMRDFYDTSTLLGTFAEGDDGDVYSLVMLQREGKTNGFSSEKKPWSLVVLRWKYDPDQKKVTLLNRVPVAGGRMEGNSALPAVFKEEALFKLVTPVKVAAPAGAPIPAPEGAK